MLGTADTLDWERLALRVTENLVQGKLAMVVEWTRLLKQTAGVGDGLEIRVWKLLRPNRRTMETDKTRMGGGS